MRSDFARDMGAQLEEAFNCIGLSMMSADFAAQLLAVVYVCGGSQEAFTHNEKLTADIGIAQRKFNIRGGERPTPEGVRLINKYVKELERAIAVGETLPWAEGIARRYSVSIV